MKKAIYLFAPTLLDDIYGPEEKADIAARVEILAPPLSEENYRHAKWEDACAQTEIIFSSWGMPPVDSAFLERFPRLEAILYGAGTVKSFATPEMWRRGIRVTSAYAANAIPVCEYTLSQILFALKQGWQQALFIRSQKRFPKPSLFSPAGGYRSTVGLISLGAIGRLVAERLQTFDLRVIATDPFVTREEGRKLGVEIVTLDALFARADVVSCHAPWLRETEKMIRGRHFAAMKPGSTFLNTSRGALVDEEEMIAALRRRPDLMAVLDVTWPEPPPDSSPLYSLENVVITPHIAGSQGKERRRMGRMMIEEMDRLLSGRPLKYEIDESRVLVMA